LRYHHPFRDPARIESLPLLRERFFRLLTLSIPTDRIKGDAAAGPVRAIPPETAMVPMEKRYSPFGLPSDLPGCLKPVRRRV